MIEITMHVDGDLTKRFNIEKAIAIVKGYVPGQILKRTDQGIDANGLPFAQYSKDYKNKLIGASEDSKVDLRLTGGLMNSIKARDQSIGDKSGYVTFAPDAAGSPTVSFVPKKRGKAYEHLSPGERKTEQYQLKRTGGHGPPHNILANWIHNGTGKTPPRPFLGLTEEEQEKLTKLLEKANLFE